MTTHVLKINSAANIPRNIQGFMNCRTCLAEKPMGISPAAWASISAGITADGLIQVWCERHNINIALVNPVEPKAQQPPVTMDSQIKIPAEQMQPIVEGLIALKHTLDYNEKNRFWCQKLIIDGVTFKLDMVRQ